MKKDKQCYWSSKCKLPAEYDGHMTSVTRRGSRRIEKKIVKKMCQPHFLLNTFGLIPFSCTKKCGNAHMKKTHIYHSQEDLVVWIDMSSTLADPENIERHTQFRVVKPLCPRCSKPMASSKSSVFTEKVKMMGYQA